MPNWDYVGMTLSDLEKIEGGLMKNLIQAKLTATAELQKKLDWKVMRKSLEI